MHNQTNALGGKTRVERFTRLYRRQMGMAGALLSGYILASTYIFGGISPFGVAFCAILGQPYALWAGLGAILGYLISAALTNIRYMVAVVLVLTIKWALGPRFRDKTGTFFSSGTALAALAITGVAAIASGDPTVYDVILIVSEIFLGAGAAYFFSRSLRAVRSGWSALNRSDISCLIVSFAIVIMGFYPIKMGGLSVGRMVTALIILVCAKVGAESGGAVAGITGGIAMGLCGGDYAYAISAYSFGGMLAGVFGNLGRLGVAGAFIAANTVAALATKTSGELYTALFEIFVASVVFVAIPQSVFGRLRVGRPDWLTGNDPTAQHALRGRLREVSVALRDISATTREVNQKLGRMNTGQVGDIYNRLAERVCADCGMKTTCWQFKYTETIHALDAAADVLKRDNSINRQKLPRYFLDSCCRLEDFLAELNTQFHDHVARQDVQRRVSRVRSVVTDQFEGVAMMLEDLAEELCGAVPLEPGKISRVRVWFEGKGFVVEQVRCHSNQYERVTVEVTIPAFQAGRLGKSHSALDLGELLEVEFDQPYLAAHGEQITAVYTEKANFSVDIGSCQFAPEGYKLCGDAYDSIANRSGKAHFVLSDGMGSGGNAAVDSHMATGLFIKLISVGFSHEAALKMVNSVLLIKSGQESLATVDICTVDLYTGAASFYKAGAAPTYLIRDGRAAMVESTSLPAGILQGVNFEKIGTALRESDVVVMVSDGVTATGCDWVKSELGAMDTGDMTQLARQLATTAKMRREDGREDDITVLAFALRKGV